MHVIIIEIANDIYNTLKIRFLSLGYFNNTNRLIDIKDNKYIR